MTNVDTSKYKVLKKGLFAFNGMHVGRDVAIPIGKYDFNFNALISPAYTTFTIDSSKGILEEYFEVIIRLDEFDRLAWFYCDASVRGGIEWKRFLDIQIPLPSIERQQEIVDTWQGLRKMKEENEAIAAPLLQLCQSYIQDLKHKYPLVELKEYIEECTEKNTQNLYDENSARGVNTNKEIQQCKRIGDKLNSYKIVHKNNIVFNANIKLTQDSEKFAVALYEEDNPCIVTGFYIVMKCNNKYILPKFLMLWLIRDEFARFVKFNSCSSVRDRFVFSDMQEVKIPLPPIEIQQAVVDLYRCANEAKKIAEEADRLSRDICPALLQHVIHEN